MFANTRSVRLTRLVSRLPPQEFTLLKLDDVADQRVNIVGFSVFNETHPFFQDFALSLNRSWQENCDHAPFAGTPVGAHATTLPGTGSGLIPRRYLSGSFIQRRADWKSWSRINTKVAFALFAPDAGGTCGYSEQLVSRIRFLFL